MSVAPSAEREFRVTNVTGYPPPFGRLGLLGAVIVAASKSCGPMARLSVKKWLPNIRRL